MRLAALFGTAALIIAQPVLAQDFSSWDADGNGMLSKQEWDTNIGEPGPFADWDIDDDGIVAEPEYQDGFFALIDKDDDGELTISEWDDGIDTWYGETAVDLDVSAWDDDGNDVITRDEFSSEYANAGIFDDFVTETEIETVELEDGNAVGVEENDFFAGLFDWFDADDDTGIVADEAGWFG